MRKHECQLTMARRGMTAPGRATSPSGCRGTSPRGSVTVPEPHTPCVRIDVVRVFQNLGARDERVQWKCVRNIHKHLKRPL